MSAKQLYFPRISRAQRGPFFSRNPLFVKGSTPRLWKQLAWSSSHADSTTFVLSKTVGSVESCTMRQLLPNISAWFDFVFSSRLRRETEEMIDSCGKSGSILCRFILCLLLENVLFLHCCFCRGHRCQPESDWVLQGSTFKKIWSSLATTSVHPDLALKRGSDSSWRVLHYNMLQSRWLM